MVGQIVIGIGKIAVGIGATKIATAAVKSITPEAANIVIKVCIGLGGIFLAGAVTTAAMDEYSRTANSMMNVLGKIKNHNKEETVEEEA